MKREVTVYSRSIKSWVNENINKIVRQNQFGIVLLDAGEEWSPGE